MDFLLTKSTLYHVGYCWEEGEYHKCSCRKEGNIISFTANDILTKYFTVCKCVSCIECYHRPGISMSAGNPTPSQPGSHTPRSPPGADLTTENYFPVFKIHLHSHPSIIYWSNYLLCHVWALPSPWSCVIIMVNIEQQWQTNMWQVCTADY